MPMLVVSAILFSFAAGSDDMFHGKTFGLQAACGSEDFFSEDGS